jgi:hypothetical protein
MEPMRHLDSQMRGSCRRSFPLVLGATNTITADAPARDRDPFRGATRFGVVVGSTRPRREGD